jgi:ribosomal protein S9
MKLKPLAVAIGLAPAFVAASGVDVTATKVSNEYLALFGGAAGAAATVELGAQYSVDDVITFTYNTNPVASAGATTAYSWPLSLAINVNTVAGTAGASTGNTVTTEGVLGFFDSGDDSVSYRVTTKPEGGIASLTGVFGTVTLPSDIEFSVASGGTDVTVTPSSKTAGGNSFDTYRGGATDNVVLDVTGTQFKYAVTGLSNTIDVESSRKKFISGTVTSTTFDVTIAVTTNLGTPSLAATAGTIAISLTGSDFSWLDSNTATNATGIQSGNITVPGGGVSAVSATAIAMTIPATGATLKLGNSVAAVIPEQTLSLALTQGHTGNSKAGATSSSATGVLTLNGSSVTVYAVPTSAAVSNFIWLTNTGATSGDVEIVINDGGEETDLGVVGVAAAGSELDLTSAMNAALEAQGVTLSGGRIHIDVITKVPSADIAISAAYRVGDDRVNLLTSLETDQ